MKVSFFERGSKLQVRVPYKGAYLRLSTGIKILPHMQFLKTKQAFKGGDDAKALNMELDRHRLFILDVLKGGYDLKKEYENFTQPTELAVETDDYSLVALCNKYIASASNGTITKRDGNRIKPSTIEAFRFATNVLNEYRGVGGSIDLLEYNLSNLQDIQKKKAMADRWNRYFTGLIDYMRSREFKINSRSVVMLNIGIMINHYAKEYFIMVPPIPKVKQVDNPIVVLDDEFLFGTFLSDDTYSKLEGNMKFVWEICATIIITTMRISDVVTLEWKNLVDRKDGLFLAKLNTKTGANTNMIIPKKLADIYRENMAKYGDIYTPITGDRTDAVYLHIEKLFAMYPELHQPRSAGMVNVQGEVEMVTKQLYEWVKPHMLRKTAITSLLNNGVSESHVKFASGHSKNSKAFEKYRAFNDRNFNNELNNYYGRMS